MDLGISKHLNKDTLHHAYLLEGVESTCVPDILSFLQTLDIDIQNNPDVLKISVDSFKIDDARTLNTTATLKAFSGSKKIFIISANSFLLEAQNAMLKLFEEPIEDTHFFIITPSIDSLIPTFVSRFYVIKNEHTETQTKDAEKFITMPLATRIEFIKELLADAEDDESEVVTVESARSRSLRFLNSLESVLHKKFVTKSTSDTKFFDHIFKVREFLRQPGSSAKSLMESVAMVVPHL